MEKRYVCSIETEPMEESIECAFESMVERKEFYRAIKFINARINKVPHYTVIRTIIFGIIMDEECDEKVAIDAGMYLDTILTIYQPSDSKRRKYYKMALCKEAKSDYNLWEAFCYLVESSFCHHKLYRVPNEVKLLKYPNCDDLVCFYVKVFLESYEYLSSERLCEQKDLVVELFWPFETTDFSAAKKHPRQFLEWINTIYEHTHRIQKVTVFSVLMQLFNLMIKCILKYESIHNRIEDLKDQADSLICNSPCLLDIVKVVMNCCKDAFNCHENLRRFMCHISLHYLIIGICKYKIYELVYSRQPSERNSSPCTLKYIVEVLMFKKPNQKRRSKLPAMEPTKGKTTKSTIKVNKSNWKNSKGDTILHEYCRLDKPADLFEHLDTTTITPNINKKNSAGYTPLHIACISKSYLCAKILIESCKENSRFKLTWTETDENRQTALHIAVQNNMCNIANMILKNGGSELINSIDKYGQKPHQYASSVEMDNVLKEFVPLDDYNNGEDDVLHVFNLNVQNMDSFKEYALYFHALQYLITVYSEVFNILNTLKMIKFGKPRIQIFSHEDKKCHHFISYQEKAACSADYVFVKHLSDIIEHFVKCATKCTKEKNLSLDLELIPLQMFSATLQF